MENLSFTLWLIFYPLTHTLNEYMNNKMKGVDSKESITAVLINIVIYIGIAILLYN